MKCPESIEELEELEKLIPLCKVTLFEQAKAKIKSGAAKSVSDAARQLGEEAGRNPEVIRNVINRGQKTVASLQLGTKKSHLSELAGTDKYTPKPLKLSSEEKQAIEKQARAIRQEKREIIQAKNEKLKQNICPPLAGQYSVIVIDPPWPMKKIERDVRPNQLELDYPVMTEEELNILSIPAAKDCHLWLWTTHKFMPMAFRLLNMWNFKYVCCFTWHKPGGFQPVGLPQYNSEFALYGRKGSPKFTNTKAFNTCFKGIRKEHSVKPVEFYEMIQRVTAGPRLDMFNRHGIEGFEGWGFEA